MAWEKRRARSLARDCHSRHGNDTLGQNVRMGRVKRSRTEALLSAPAPEGVATLERWSESLSARLRYTEGARLVDAWFVPADGRLVAFMDAPEERSFDWVIDETARVLAISPETVELRMLVSLRDRWAFRGDPAVPDPTRRNPRAARWDRIDVAPDDQTLRVEFMHGIVDGLHHVELYETTKRSSLPSSSASTMISAAVPSPTWG
jgi:hypothetical protein